MDKKTARWCSSVDNFDMWTQAIAQPPPPSCGGEDAPHPLTPERCDGNQVDFSLNFEPSELDFMLDCGLARRACSKPDAAAVAIFEIGQLQKIKCWPF
jgi:hypothetical protein